MSAAIIKPSQVAVICPTKDQPDKVKRLLTCLAQSSIKPGQVLIADGGHNLKPVIKEFENSLNLACLYCPEAGQVLQRNYAHTKLASKIKLVIHFDDDITFDKDAIGVMLDYWNKTISSDQGNAEKPLGGAAFNIVDLPRLRQNIFRKIFFLSVEPHGHVSRGGYAAPFCPANTTHEVEWVFGGATIWRRDIIDTYHHPLSFQTRWAVCEDLIFSYPLQQDFRLMVVHEAIMQHNETYTRMTFKQGVFYGVSSVIMRYHFNRMHNNLSMLAFIWMTLGVMAGQLIFGLMGSSRHLGLFTGNAEGLMRAIFNWMTFSDSTKLARNLVNRKR